MEERNGNVIRADLMSVRRRPRMCWLAMGEPAESLAWLFPEEIGDVEAWIGGRRVVAECKKGPLVKKPGSLEYPLLTTAIGQALLFKAEEDDILVAAVPDTSAFRRISEEWRQRPRLKRAGIQIVLVSRTGAVSGLPESPCGAR